MDIFGDEEVNFSINKGYADNYDRWRQKEELQKLKDKYGDDVDSSSSTADSEDEEAEALTPQLEKDWLRTLAAIKSKDPKIYKKDFTFYKHSSASSAESESSSGGSDAKATKNKERPMFLKDYERKFILEKGGILSESDSEDDEKKAPGYFEEQQQIKDSIKSLVDDVSDSGDEFLTKRTKTKEELQKEEEDYLLWLKGQKDELSADSKVGIELNPLKDYWSDPSLPAGEKFLRDYILNKGYRDEEDNEIPTYDEIVNENEELDLDNDVDVSEDEREMEKGEVFEHKYNFRFEDPDPEFIKSYPRTVQNSLRRKDTQRVEKRQETKARKRQEKERKMEELKQLRNLKKREVMEKIEKIKQVAGNDELGVSAEDLEDDFDPAKHDKLMQKMFSGDYYGGEEDLEKPQWEDEELETEDWDQWTGEGQGQEENDAADNEDNEGDGCRREGDDGRADGRAEAQEYFMDADYDPSQEVTSKKRKRKSRFARAVTKKKPVFNPDEATFEEYFDEFYKLDYEDVVANQPCRFKYRQVQANDFGLSTEEVLSAKERELNQWVSVKKMVQYRTTEEEKLDCLIYRKKGTNMKKKMHILTSLTKPEEEVQEPKKKKRKRRKKGKEYEDKAQIYSALASKYLESQGISESDSKVKRSTEETNEAVNPGSRVSGFDTDTPKVGGASRASSKHENATETENNRKDAEHSESIGQGRKKKSKRRKKPGVTHGPVNVLSDDRLKAYGLNPKKIKYTHPHIKTKTAKSKKMSKTNVN